MSLCPLVLCLVALVSSEPTLPRTGAPVRLPMPGLQAATRGTAQPTEPAGTVLLTVSATTREPDGRLTVTLTNTGNRTIVAWSLRVTSTGADGKLRASVRGGDMFRKQVLRQVGFSTAAAAPPTPVPSGGTTTYTFAPPEGRDPRVVPVAVVFDDASFAGDAALARAFLSHREAIARVLDPWVGELLRIGQLPVAQWLPALRADLARLRAPGGGYVTTEDEMPAVLEQLIRNIEQHPEQAPTALASIGRYLDALRQAARQHLR